MRRLLRWSARVLSAGVVLSSLGCPGESTAPKATSVVQARGLSQAGTAGTAVAVAPAVKVIDGSGKGFPGASVVFAVSTGGGTVAGGTATTDADGIASVGSWTLGTVAGLNSLVATSPGLGSTVTFVADGKPGPATKLAIVTEPAGAEDGLALTTQPVLLLRDAFDNLATTATNSVTAAMTSGTSVLSGTKTITAVAGIATYTSLVLTGVSTGTMQFTAAGFPPATSASIATAPAQPQNLTIDGLYLTQATQTYQGTVPLIAARAGLLRVFVKATRTNTLQPAVRVRLYSSGTLVQTYTITSQSVSVPTTISEANLSAAWNVAVPANLIQANLSVLADVDPSGGITESSKTDNFFPASGTPLALTVRTPPVLRVTLIPVRDKNGLQGDVNDANKDSYMEYAMRVYPVASYDAVIHAPFSFTSVPPGTSYDSVWNRLLNEIYMMQTTEGILNRNYYGVIKPSYSSGGTGFGYIGGNRPSAVGVEWLTNVSPSTTLRAMTAAHEWGHNFGRNHVGCGNPSSPDASYPYPTSSVGAYGYDMATSQVYRPTDYVDFMSYCRPVWISDYTYKAVLDYRDLHFAPATSAAPQHSLMVWGRIGADGLVLEPSFEIDAPPSLPTRPGPYNVQATDAAGRVLFNLSFEGEAVDHTPGERHFAFVVPLSATASPLAALRLVANGREVIRRAVPPTAGAAGAASALSSARLTSISATRSRLEWNATAYPAALVRDPATGQVLSIARDGVIDVARLGPELDVTFSDGVSSVRRRIAISPR